MVHFCVCVHVCIVYVKYTQIYHIRRGFYLGFYPLTALLALCPITYLPQNLLKHSTFLRNVKQLLLLKNLICQK